MRRRQVRWRHTTRINKFTETRRLWTAVETRAHEKNSIAVDAHEKEEKTTTHMVESIR